MTLISASVIWYVAQLIPLINLDEWKERLLLVMLSSGCLVVVVVVVVVVVMVEMVKVRSELC